MVKTLALNINVSSTLEAVRKYGVSWFDVNADCIASREFSNLKAAKAYCHKLKRDVCRSVVNIELSRII